MVSRIHSLTAWTTSPRSQSSRRPSAAAQIDTDRSGPAPFSITNLSRGSLSFGFRARLFIDAAGSQDLIWEFHIAERQIPR